MALAARPVIEQAGVEAEVSKAMAAILSDANEEPDGFLVHSPDVIHELRLGDRAAQPSRETASRLVRERLPRPD